MTPSTSRRRLLQVGGLAALTGLAGCSTQSLLGQDTEEPTYELTIDRLDHSLVEEALYTPREEGLFGDSSQAALDEILPTGRYTTYGFESLPPDRYLEHDGTYYQTEHIVTGRERRERTVVRVTDVPESSVTSTAMTVDELESPSDRVVYFLHRATTFDNTRNSSVEFRDGYRYVLRRPAERESRMATGELDGEIVTVTDNPNWAYRLDISQEPIVETAHTVFAVQVADSRSAFREIAFGDRIDADLSNASLPREARDVLSRAIAQGSIEERGDLSSGFQSLLRYLNLETDNSVNGQLLWYDGELYRYGFYAQPES